MQLTVEKCEPVVLDPDRVAKLCQVIGACLMQYQQVEAFLKLLLPHLRLPGEPEPEQPMHWRMLIDSKTTLGPLVEQFKEKANTDDPEGFSQFLSQLVLQRNDLIHHRFTDVSRPLITPDELEEAIGQVNNQILFVAPFVRALRLASVQFKSALDAPSCIEASRINLAIGERDDKS